MIIAPWSCDARLREDSEKDMLDAKEVLKNVPRHSGNYIEVPVVINE
jgi:Asp-tRNA(Asn)/Glu-tRNA(Gln) amidotransferase C subunit